MTRLFMIFFLLVVSSGSFAQSGVQTGSIKGTITGSDNTPAASATVRLKGTKKAALTNNEGFFTIEHIQPGNYTLSISSVGHQLQEKEVVVVAGSSTEVSIQLSQAKTQ